MAYWCAQGRWLTRGQCYALAVLQGGPDWRTAKDMRVKPTTLDALARLGLAVSRRRGDRTEWAAVAQSTLRDAA